MNNKDSSLRFIYTVYFTFGLLVVEGGFALFFLRRLGREGWGGIRGSDLHCLLFMIPFNLLVLALWIELLGPRLLPDRAPVLRADRQPLAAGCIVALPVWILVVFSPLVTRGVSLPHAIAGWVLVLGAFAGGYLWERLATGRGRTNDGPLAHQATLPSRHLPGGMAPTSSVPPIAGKIDGSPMPSSPTGITNEVLSRTSEACFVARPGLSQRLVVGAFGLFWTVAAPGYMYVMIYNDKNITFIKIIVDVAIPSAIAAAGLFLALAAVFQDGTVEFDVQFDRVTYGQRWARKSRALSDVVAVQFLTIVPRHEGGRSDSGDRHCRFQVNLVTGDPSEQRINVIQNVDIEQSRDSARRIAAALNVPLIDGVVSSAAKAGR